MSEAQKLLFCTMEENWRLARQAEEKRATIAAVNLIVISGLQSVLVVYGLGLKTLPLALWMLGIGVYGIVATAKLYERSQFHILRARKLRARLDVLSPDAQEEELQRRAEEEHRKRYPLLIDIRLNALWIGLHCLIVALGLYDTIASILR